MEIKAVGIWDSEGNCLQAGICLKETFMAATTELIGHWSAEAEAIWDEATLYSLKDWIWPIQVRVRLI